MNAEFKIPGGLKVQIKTPEVPPDGSAYVNQVTMIVDLDQGAKTIELWLGQSEARAIASALMGAAAEL